MGWSWSITQVCLSSFAWTGCEEGRKGATKDGEPQRERERRKELPQLKCTSFNLTPRKGEKLFPGIMERKRKEKDRKRQLIIL